MRLPLRRARSSVAVTAVLLCAALLVARGQSPGAGPGAPLTIRTLDPYGGDRDWEGSPQTGGTLVIGNDREIISFDPTRQNSNLAATMVYDSLFKLMPDGTAQPYLAASMTSPDGGVPCDMGLRDGVRFSTAHRSTRTR